MEFKSSNCDLGFSSWGECSLMHLYSSYISIVKRNRSCDKIAIEKREFPKNSFFATLSDRPPERQILTPLCGKRLWQLCQKPRGPQAGFGRGQQSLEKVMASASPWPAPIPFRYCRIFGSPEVAHGSNVTTVVFVILSFRKKGFQHNGASLVENAWAVTPHLPNPDFPIPPPQWTLCSCCSSCQALGEQMHNGIEIKDRTYRLRVSVVCWFEGPMLRVGTWTPW